MHWCDDIGLPVIPHDGYSHAFGRLGPLPWDRSQGRLDIPGLLVDDGLLEEVHVFHALASKRPDYAANGFVTVLGCLCT